MKVDTEIKKIIEEQFYGWEQTSQGDWERYMKGGKTKTIFNTYENKERNLLLKEKISEDRGGGGKSAPSDSSRWSFRIRRPSVRSLPRC